MTNGDQRLLQVFRATNYLKTCDEEYPDDSFEEVDIEEDDNFFVEQTDHHEFSSDGNPNNFDWLRQPAKIWRDSKSKRIQEVTFIFTNICAFLLFRSGFTMIDVKMTVLVLKLSNTVTN
jgi:hypothetical protein